MATGGHGLYTFSSRPRIVETRPKYRAPPCEQLWTQRIYGDIMYDRRVVRGNTYGQHATTAQPDPTETSRRRATRAVAGRAAGERPGAAGERPGAAGERFDRSAPEALQSRRLMHVQTELYLEELNDAVAAVHVECQTDPLLDKPASPLFIPTKSGKDVATQIEQGELFDFNLEVQPLLEVLVGKTMEQSLLEVMEEEELAALRAQQRTYEELRNSRLAEVQRLRERERRHRQEKERRIAQQKEVLRKERETAEKIAARAYTRHYLAGLVPTILGSLGGHGYFYDPVERDIETNFLPWLMTEVSKTLRRRSTAREMLDMIICDTLKKRLEAFRNLETHSKI